ncbi:MAG: long-chain fatty acid--CoA ligase, partial [Bacteroidia bacterium]
SALIVPAFSFVRDWCLKKGIDAKYFSNEQLVSHPQAVQRIMQEVEETNQKFGAWEQIKRPKFLPAEFTIDGGELTPTLKLKRKVIIQKYAKEIAEIYG